MSSKKYSQAAEGHGIPGYENKLWHHDTEKPTIYGIHKEMKKRHYLDNYLRSKQFVPAPTSYNITKDMTIKANAIVNKSPRITQPEEIQVQAKKDKFPDVGSYSPNYKKQEARLLGCFGFKSDRSGFLEERQVIGKESAPFGIKNYN